MFLFFYYDKNGERFEFHNLSERQAKSMYNLFNKNMALHGYKKVGWERII
jgi:hypothetical protein